MIRRLIETLAWKTGANSLGSPGQAASFVLTTVFWPENTSPHAVLYLARPLSGIVGVG